MGRQRVEPYIKPDFLEEVTPELKLSKPYQCIKSTLRFLLIVSLFLLISTDFLFRQRMLLSHSVSRVIFLQTGKDFSLPSNHLKNPNERFWIFLHWISSLTLSLISWAKEVVLSGWSSFQPCHTPCVLVMQGGSFHLKPVTVVWWERL